jgi:hypothetical protein
MWNPLRRGTSERNCPKPQWAPIQDPHSIDIVGLRRDGGLDLVICASQPIDDDPETLNTLRSKVRAYLREIDEPAFQEETGHRPPDKTSIVIACEYPIHPKAQAVIDECRQIAAGRNVKLELRNKA